MIIDTESHPVASDASAHHSPEAPTERRDWRDAILIALCCLIVYNANLRSIGAGDTYPARYLPFAIWKHQTVLIDPIAPMVAQGRGSNAYWIVDLPDGHKISLYPVTLPLLIAPLYLPAVAYVQSQGWTISSFDRAARVMEKVSASLLAALSSSLLFLLLRRRVSRNIALTLTIAYAFGSTTWMISSQALWQHGMAQLLVVCAVMFLTASTTPRNALIAGLMLGLIAANRPPDAIISVVLGTYALFRFGRRAPLLIAGAAAPTALLLAFNREVAGNIAGGYGIKGRPEFFAYELLDGLGGLLVSPTRGLLVFSPFLLFLSLVPRYLPPDRRERWLTIAMAVAVVLQLGMYAKADWRGGISWGPRYLTDLLPLLVWMLAPVAAALRGLTLVFFRSAIAVSIVIEVIGAFFYTGVTDGVLFAEPAGPGKMDAAWQWRNAPFVAPLKNAPALPELGLHIWGSFDEFQGQGQSVSEAMAGSPLIARGWALAGSRPPWQVGLMIDGGTGPVTRSFNDRPDVRRALASEASAGWDIQLDTATLAPGDHSVAAVAWLSHDLTPHYLGERTLTIHAAKPPIPPPIAAETKTELNLDGAFQTAAARIRAHQQEPGYWLTTFTSGTRFEQPHPEMNTFLTSFMIDLLDPIARSTEMEGTLRRAREHLTAQIEPGGLVRYHGLPTAPGIGTLGCAITPDTDDTALVWRIAPRADRRELSAALKTIDQYRTAEGLYRTWLAPRDAFQCIDPGSDPNPPDIAIQMNLLMLLAEEKPGAGRALCSSLRKVIDEDRVWVYYRVTPIVAMLRLPDLARAGCRLELPERRMRTSVAEQEIWVSTTRALIDAQRSREVDPAKMRDLLERIAENDFALLRNNPPLIYHNDLTASVRRYYWSEDFGYALWLRLAHAHDGIKRKRASD